MEAVGALARVPALLRPVNYLVPAAFFITLEIYRVDTPLGLSAAPYHVFLGLALYVGALAVLSRAVPFDPGRGNRVYVPAFLLFVAWSFIVALRSWSVMRPESRSLFMAGCIGYMEFLALAAFANLPVEVDRISRAFIASSLFVYLGAAYHLVIFLARGAYVTGTPFWHAASPGSEAASYLENPSAFLGFPRFRLPFASPAGTGTFLALAGVLLLAITMGRMSRRRQRSGLLHVLNATMFLCLVGTLSRAAWAVYLVGACVAGASFRGMRFRAMRVFLVPVVLLCVTAVAVAYASGIGHELIRVIGLRFSPEATESSNVGHMQSRLLALQYWRENPIFGLGVGGFLLRPGGGVHTHCTYLTLLVERGLVGLGLYLTFFVALFAGVRGAWRRAVAGGDDGRIALGVGFMAGLAGLAMGHWFYEMSNEVVWLFMGLCAAYAGTGRE